MYAYTHICCVLLKWKTNPIRVDLDYVPGVEPDDREIIAKYYIIT